MPTRRRVITRERAPRGGHTKLWGYGYETLSRLLGMTPGSLRNAVAAGRLDPGDLESICEAWLRRRARKEKKTR